MKKEDKDLLFKDLSARLPYGVICKCKKYKHFLFNSSHISLIESEEIKPYLFPLSSITEKQSMELFKLFGINLTDSTDYIKINECTGITFFLNKGFDVETHLNKLIDWFNSNHFDYRGLIEKGLAINATGLNIY